MLQNLGDETLKTPQGSGIVCSLLEKIQKKKLDIPKVKTSGFDEVALRLWFESSYVNKSRIILFWIQQIACVKY